MRIEPFAMERLQSIYENLVEFNLSESGVHPLRLGELLEDHEAEQQLKDEPLAYTQSNGTPQLRSAIASLYPGTSIDHIEVTNGGSEANFIVTWNLIDPGDEVVLMAPNYMQTWGLSRAFGGAVGVWRLREDRGWQADIDQLQTLVTDRTKLIVICNPNNPTGACLGEKTLDEICRIAAAHGSWILSDEIYRGAEFADHETPSIWGRYDRVIVTSGLSKAYGLPGLRIGWIVGPPALLASLWSYHDYTTIAPSALSDHLARRALTSARPKILQRTRRIIRENWPVLASWLDSHGDAFVYRPPEAGAIVFIRYLHDINSTRLAERLRDEYSVLIVPGDHFGMEGYIRLGFGPPIDYLNRGLERLDALLATLPTHAPQAR